MKERILAFCKASGISANAFEVASGWSPSTVYNLNKGVRSDKLASVAKAFPDLNLDWLITGEGEMFKSESKEDGKEIPVLPFTAVAGYLAENNNEVWTDVESCKVPEFTARGADFLIRVEGDSMYPRYGNGELLAIRVVKDPTFFQWGKVYCLSTNQGCVVKRLFPDPADERSIICHSENYKLYPDYKITKDDVLGVAIVVGHIGLE